MDEILTLEDFELEGNDFWETMYNNKEEIIDGLKLRRAVGKRIRHLEEYAKKNCIKVRSGNDKHQCDCEKCMYYDEYKKLVET